MVNVTRAAAGANFSVFDLTRSGIRTPDLPQSEQLHSTQEAASLINVFKQQDIMVNN